MNRELKMDDRRIQINKLLNFCRFLLPFAVCYTSLAIHVCVAQELTIPKFRQQRVIVSATDGEVRKYLAFPALVDLESEVLVSFKRGRSHANDTGAGLDIVRLREGSGEPSDLQCIARLEDGIMQMGEWIKFPNGDFASFIDAQKEPRATRIGLRSVRFRKGGKAFEKVQRLGLVNGVEYGYAFDSLVKNGETLVLAMRFANLAGGKSLVPARPHAGSVDVLRSKDNGESWEFLKDLSHEFGDIPINESAFVEHSLGFLVTTRGYDSHHRLHLVDADFNVVKRADLTDESPYVEREIGRPRLISRDGNYYLLGRNWTNRAHPMQLCWLRIDPESLRIVSAVVLDNASGDNVTDGYYADVYFRERKGRTFAHVITYKGLNHAPPEIIELTFDWSELR